MSFFLRRSTTPSLQEITSVPQIVIVDETGPAVSLGTRAGSCCLIGEFIKGSFLPYEVGSGGEAATLYGNKVYPYFSQGATGIQDGSQTGYAPYNGNGNLQLLNRAFRRLAILRVDHEAVTTDGGIVRSTLSVTVTVATTDQDGSGNTNKDIVIPAGARFGSAATFAGSTRVFAASGDTIIPKGTALTTNAVTVQVVCFPIRVVEPVVATAIASITFVLDAVLNNVASGTSITAVTNAAALWPPGTGTTLSARLESQYVAAINKTQPGSAVTSNIAVLWSARRSVLIRQTLAANAKASSEMGRGRMAIVAADPAATASSTDAAAAKTAALGLAVSDGYAQPDAAERTIITFPHSKVVSVDLGSIAVTISSDGRAASTLSNFAEEVNPGAANVYMSDISALEDAFEANRLQKGDYANLIAAGVMALYNDRATGWQWMQGVTAVNSVSYPTRVPIKRRRMADLIQDSLGEQAAPYLKGPATTERVDALVSAHDSFLKTLLSPNQPSAQRIAGYKLDPDGGNTPDLQALGIYVILVWVRLLPSMDYILYRTQIGETVTVPTTILSAA